MSKWRDEAEKRSVGDRVQLKTLPGHYIIPRRYSTETQDRLTALAGKTSGSGLTQETLDEIDRREETGEELGRAVQLRIQSELGGLEEGVYIDQARITLLGGLHEFGDETAEERFTGDEIPALVEEILQYNELAAEILDVIREGNRPLAGKNGSKSAMSSKSSTPADKS